MSTDREHRTGGGSVRRSAPISRKFAGQTRKVAGLLRLAWVLGMAARGLAQTSYTAIELGSLGAGTSYATGINASGQVVGESWIANGEYHAFLYSGGSVIDLGTLPGYRYSVATGINASGQVVGYSCTATDQTDCHAFLYSDGTMLDLGTLGGSYSQALGINDSGQVVGSSQTARGDYHVFLYGGTMKDLGTLGGTNGIATGINAGGQVVGSSYTAGTGVIHAVLYYNGGALIDLGALGGSTSYANAINASGQVVGQAQTASGWNVFNAFLYSGRTMIDLGTLGGSTSYANAINASGQVVGQAQTAGGDNHAFLHRGGTMADLNGLVNLPQGVFLGDATAINGRGQIVANAGGGHAYLLTPTTSSLQVVNPFALYAGLRLSPPTLDVPTVLNSPPASNLAADGLSAVVLVYQSPSQQPVTFEISAPVDTSLPYGSLAPFDPNYLASPNPVGGSYQRSLAVTPSSCDTSTCTFVALLWGPGKMPLAGVFPSVPLTASATQPGAASIAQGFVTLMPPPLLLIHGVWSSAKGTGFTADSSGFYQWIAGQYPHNQIFPVDYGSFSSNSFSDPNIQSTLLNSITDALASAGVSGMAARQVDLVGHSMGGLVTRYLLSTPGPLAGDLLPNPVHRLITIGTPHQGSNLATVLFNNKDQTVVAAPPLVVLLCAALSSCTLGDLFGSLGKPVGTGVESLEPGSPELGYLSPTTSFSAIVGEAPVLSSTEVLLDILITAFLPGQTVGNILNEVNDTIVPISSQDPAGAADTATICGIVHAAVAPPDTGETASLAVWQQAFYWLTGGTGQAAGTGCTNTRQVRGAAPGLILDLTGYTQVPPSNVSFSPSSGTVLSINTPTSITATSSAKTIIEILLLQTVMDPADTPLLAATQAPFTIAFTPTRLGSVNFAAIAVFSDNTYATATLNYPLQASGIPFALNLVNAPVASMPVGTSRVVNANAQYTNGTLDVTQAASYSVRSGTSNVFSVGPGGTITAWGAGTDWLDVSYGGVTSSAQIPVGACTYGLNPVNQIVSYTGGAVGIQVTVPTGCGWTAAGGSGWLSFSNATGSGNGVITLTAAPNNTGSTQSAIVMLAGQQALLTQPAIACTYQLSQTQINAPAAGASGTITVTTACPVIASSNAAWVSATPLGSSVAYTVAPNSGTPQRTATLTIGTQAIPVVQTGSVIPGLSNSGLNPSSAVAGGPAFTLMVTGTNFVSGALVDWNGAALATTFVSSTQLTASVQAALIASAGTASVTVVNPGGASSASVSFPVQGQTTPAGLRFVPVTPCRVADTRNANGPFGGPILSAYTTRDFAISAGPCGIPFTAQAYSLNVAVVPSGRLGYLTAWPTGQPQPTAATLNSWDGRIKSNAAIIPAGAGGAITIFVNGTTDVILDINGYFIAATDPSGLAFYPLTPCRVVDTRYGSGPLAGPRLAAGQVRDFPILSSACTVPATAQSYSLNFAVVPKGSRVGFLTAWPSGQAQPVVATLNATTGTVVANAAIVPAGLNGDISVYTIGDTDLVIDMNGYFAPAGAGGLSLYTVTPCRVLDTRYPTGAQPFSGQLDVNVAGSTCNVSAGAGAYVFNATVVPPGTLIYLTLWPNGQLLPNAATLNAFDGAVTSNMALVPTSNGFISAWASNPTHLILDAFGYFAP